MAVLRYAYLRAFTLGVAITKPALMRVVNRRLGIPTPPLASHPALRERAGLIAPYLLEPPEPLLVSIRRADAPRFLPVLEARLAGRAQVDLRGFAHQSP